MTERLPTGKIHLRAAVESNNKPDQLADSGRKEWLATGYAGFLIMGVSPNGAADEADPHLSDPEDVDREDSELTVHCEIQT